MSEVAWTDRFAAPLDGVRRATLSRALRNRPLRAAFSSRDGRVAWIISGHALAALAFTLFFPAPLIVLLPLVLGVPHVVADVRYLVLRRSIGNLARIVILGGSAVLLGTNALSLAGGRFDVARAEVVLGSCMVTVVGVIALASSQRASRRAKVARGGLVLLAVMVLACVAASVPRTALVLLIHAHNVIALIAWLWLFRVRVRPVLLPMSLLAGATLVLVSGALVPATLRFGVWRAFGTNLLAAADWLAPGVPGALGVGLASSFIFLQSVHYLVWLVLVPADDRPGVGSVSFRRSFREITRDLGAPALVIAIALSALVAGSGAVAPFATRNAYLSLASFHVWLELAVLCFYAVGGPAWTVRHSVPG
jgi:hypothetical protein